jgi:predicted nucleic acid-binding protein
MVLVDSSVWIEAARRTGDLAVKVGLEGLLEEYEAAICPPVRLEVLGGARQEDRPRLNRALGILPSVPFTGSTWDNAVKHAWSLRDQGVVVPWNDLLIATLALERECRLYAKDRHFETMQPILGLALYAPGYGGSFVPGKGV